MEQTMAKIQNKVKFRYVKGNDHRIIHADGAKGGLTNRGFLLIDFFAEYPNYFNDELHKITKAGQLEQIVQKVDTSQPIELIRERQIGVMMSISVAKSLAIWINARVKEFNDSVDAIKTQEAEK